MTNLLGGLITSASGGKWDLLSYIEASSPAETLDTNTFTPKDFLHIFFWNPANSGTRATVLRVGSAGTISTTGYKFNRWNPGTYESDSSADNIIIQPDTLVNSDFYSVIDIMNLDGQPKSILANSTTSTIPNTGISGGSWTTTAQINIIQMNCSLHGGTNANVSTGAFIEVWGANKNDG